MSEIFVVEDAKLDKAIIKDVLNEMGYKVKCFFKAETVINFMKKIDSASLPKLIIIDIILAGQISGYQLAQKIKSNYNIPVIFLTGASDDKVQDNKQLLNGDLFLNKPIDQSELKNNVKIIMEKTRSVKTSKNDINENLVKYLDNQIWYYKDPYTYKMVNESYARFFGKNKENFNNEYIFNILAAKDAEEIIAENIDIFWDKKTFRKEKWVRNFKGESRLFKIKKTPIFNNRGNVKHLFCQAKDITEQNILENELRRNRDNLQRVIETIPDMIFLINKAGDILDVWTEDESQLLYSKKEAISKNIKEFLSRKTYNIYQTKINELFNEEKPVTFEYSLKINEEKKYYEARMLNINSYNQSQRIVVSVRDISKRKKSNLKLGKISREYETIFSNVENAIFLINVENETLKFQRLNTFHEKSTGLKTENIKGKTPVEIFGEELGLELEENYKQCLKKKVSISYEEELDLPAGRRVWLTKLTPVINDGEVEKIVGTSLDITENKQREKEIEYLSFHDKMTDLYNRRYFENEIQRLDSSRRLPITIIIADLDNLKYINDNYGHQKGDDYIKTAAQIIKDSIRKEDIAARIGGDEFALILPQTGGNGAHKIFQRIKEKENNYLKRNDSIEIFSISIGYAVKDRKEVSLEETFKKADQKMYANKTENKKR
ncbi:diguanylate cyclase [Halanaerobacter jeridensis]|uniref:Stage 0 sporulation protein A homolog n=1 Tax=Halanaerobacter jeridensis TaxID=706427 RepID=A0A939BM16_9FIRM|nr:diguanylate cyclase [Halanaerobacter jeridensis]MBM7555410.1 diguanylate cyclase (GGDEF)-like protein/PAS domain S-box-containing protein [Halanaerobacter jeridensis]